VRKSLCAEGDSVPTLVDQPLPEAGTGDSGVNRPLWILKGLGANNERVPSMQIRVSVFKRPVDQQIKPPGPPGPGRRFIFSLDLQLDEFDGQKQQGQHVGTYSGVVTVLREPGASDNFYKNGGTLVEYQSTYKFEAVGPVQGGTGPYAKARGSITAPGEMGVNSTTRLLDIQLAP
jgi:hypothetical protein